MLYVKFSINGLDHEQSFNIYLFYMNVRVRELWGVLLYNITIWCT